MRVSKRTLIDVGVFVTIGVGLAMVVVFFIGRERSLFEKRYTLIAPFKDISGLRMGAVVRLAGLNVGYVDGVRFPADKGSDHLEVMLKISEEYKERIRKDSRAGIQTQGLLGDKFISLTTGNPAMPTLEDGNVLQTEGIGGVAALADAGKELMEDLKETSKKFRETLDKLPVDPEDKWRVKEILWNMQATTADIKSLTARIRKGEGTVGGLLVDSSLYHDLRALLGRASRNKLLKRYIRAAILEQEKGTRMPVEEEK